jgi:hypothetical protein
MEVIYVNIEDEYIDDILTVLNQKGFEILTVLRYLGYIICLPSSTYKVKDLTKINGIISVKNASMTL